MVARARVVGNLSMLLEFINIIKRPALVHFEVNNNGDFEGPCSDAEGPCSDAAVMRCHPSYSRDLGIAYTGQAPSPLSSDAPT